jgi:hypothetical protein
MGAAGVFPDDARVELIEGELLTLPPMGIPHRWAVATLTRALEVHHTPVNGTYATVSILEPGTPVRLQAFPELPFDWSIALA